MITYSPREPADLVELGEGGHDRDDDRADNRKDDGAGRVVGERVESDARTNDPSSCTQNVGNEVERTDELTEPGAPDVVRHVGDGVAACVLLAEPTEPDRLWISVEHESRSGSDLQYRY